MITLLFFACQDPTGKTIAPDPDLELVVTVTSPFSWNEWSETGPVVDTRPPPSGETVTFCEHWTLEDLAVGDTFTVAEIPTDEETCIEMVEILEMEIPSTINVACEIESSLTLAEWYFEWLGYEETFSVNLGSESWAEDGLPLEQWWILPVDHTTFEGETLLATIEEPSDESYGVYLYGYTFALPSTLVEMIFCDEELCEGNVLFHEVWPTEAMAWYGAFDTCRLAD